MLEHGFVGPGYRFIVLIFLLAGNLTAQTNLRGMDSSAEAERESPLQPRTSQVQGTVWGISPALEGPIDPASYSVGPGDIFLISIIGAEPYLEVATVTPTGKLVVPDIGSFQVSTLTVSGVRELVLKRIKEVYPTYEADCILYDIREIRVSISGAVSSPGFYQVTPVSRVSDLIALAGGYLTNAAMHRVLWERPVGETRAIDLTAFYYTGDLSQNPTLLEGDQVIIPFGEGESEMASSRGLRPVMVTGEVNNPGSYTYQPGLRVQDYIALAGGPTVTGSERALRVIRVSGERVDPDAGIRAGDIIYVPRSFNSVFLGQLGMIQAALTFLNFYLAYLAARAS